MVYTRNMVIRLLTFKIYLQMKITQRLFFSQKFDTDLKGHNWSVLGQPKGILFNRGWCANYHVFWDTVKLFDFVDGSSGAISDSELTSRRWSSDALFGQRDPRFRASVFIQKHLGKDLCIHHMRILLIWIALQKVGQSDRNSEIETYRVFSEKTY